MEVHYMERKSTKHYNKKDGTAFTSERGSGFHVH